MRKLLLSLAIVFCMASTCFAKNYAFNMIPEDSSGNAITAYDVSNGSTITTARIKVKDNVGFGTLQITESKAGGAGDIDVYVTYSLDGTNFYRPCLVPSTMNGTCTAEANIRTALQNDTELIPFPIRLAEWIKIEVEADADSTVSLRFIYQEN